MGRSPGGGHGNPLQCSCLENPIDRGACWATVHGIAKSQTQLKQLSTHAHIKVCKGKRLLFWRKTIRERLHTRGVLKEWCHEIRLKRNVDYGLGTWSPSIAPRSPPNHHTVKVKTNVATRQVALLHTPSQLPPRSLLQRNSGAPQELAEHFRGESGTGTDLGQNGEVRLYLPDSAYRAFSFPRGAQGFYEQTNVP